MANSTIENKNKSEDDEKVEKRCKKTVKYNRGYLVIIKYE